MADVSELIARWVDTARWAPSGDNLQLWNVRFEEHATHLTLCLSVSEEGKQHPGYFDVENCAATFSLGCLAHNIVELAREDGYAYTKLTFEEPTQEFKLELTATKTTDARTPDSKKSEWIRKRTVNRKLYKMKAVQADFYNPVNQILSRYPEFKLKSLFPRRFRVAWQYTRLDRFRYHHRRMYREFLETIRLGKHPQAAENGLWIKTLGISGPSQILIYLLRRFKWMRVLVYLGLDWPLAIVGTFLRILRAGDFLVLSTTQDSPTSWFKMGMCFQEIWLKATETDVSLQPFGVSLTVYRKFVLGEGPNSLLKVARKFEKWGVNLRNPSLGFRVGYGPPVTYRAARKPLAFEFTPQTTTPLNETHVIQPPQN